VETSQRQSALLGSALSYMGRGWGIIDLPPGTKNPGRPGWQNERYDEETIRRRVSSGPRNLSVLLGEPSGGLVDVDLDCPEARMLAGRFLPPTGACFGRASSQRSHLLYVVDPVPEYERFVDPEAPDEDRATLLELRSGGQHTIFPPSMHPSGESIEWEQEGEPASLAGDELLGAVSKLAAASLLARHWHPKGQRHEQSLTLAGGLLRGGFTEEEAARFVECVAWAAGDEEWRTRSKDVATTAKKLEKGRPVVGWPKLGKLMGTEVVGRLREWLGMGGAGGYKPTDDELSDRWLARSADERAYGLGTWMRYGEGMWEPLAEAVVQREIMDILRAAKVEKIRPTASLLRSVETLSRIAVTVPDEKWDADPDVLVCANGTLHIPTGDLREHDPEHHATSAVPYEYDLSAEAPAWERFLREVAGVDVAPFLQEFAGYALTTDTSHELALWLYGPPGGGRSTFLAGLGAMLGPRAGLLGLSEIQRNRFALADIPGKTLLTATEQPAGYLRTSHVLNALISGEPIQVEKKYRDPFVLVPRAKIAWAMNELPRVGSASDGLFRRVKVLHFEGIPEEERDPAVKSAIEGEGAGILNWALVGLDRLRERGRFEVPDAVKDATAHWQETNDVPALFVAEVCTVDEERRTTGRNLYIEYTSWCESNGHKPKSSTSVSEDWQRLGFERKRIQGKTYYVGLSVPMDNRPPY
jgi:putative DNA primase/helicase